MCTFLKTKDRKAKLVLSRGKYQQEGEGMRKG
jgi:hypothetical protein